MQLDNLFSFRFNILEFNFKFLSQNRLPFTKLPRGKKRLNANVNDEECNSKELMHKK